MAMCWSRMRRELQLTLVCNQSVRLWQCADRECAENYDWHSFVTSQLDYGNVLIANAPRTTTDKLQRVLNAAAQVITGTRKFDRGLTHILHDELLWLDVAQCVTFKLCMTVYKCLHGLALQYLSELCVPVADVTSRGLLRFPRYTMTSYNQRAFSYASPGTYFLKMCGSWHLQPSSSAL